MCNLNRELSVKRTQEGFTLVEVVVAAVLFTATVAGIYAAFGSLSDINQAQNINNNKMVFGQRFFDRRYAAMGTDSWGGGGAQPLAVCGDTVIPADPNFSGYGGTYTISAHTSGARQLTLTINTP